MKEISRLKKNQVCLKLSLQLFGPFIFLEPNILEYFQISDCDSLVCSDLNDLVKLRLLDSLHIRAVVLRYFAYNE